MAMAPLGLQVASALASRHGKNAVASIGYTEMGLMVR